MAEAASECAPEAGRTECCSGRCVQSSSAAAGRPAAPRIHESLAVRGHRVSRRRVDRLMRTDGMRASVSTRVSAEGGHPSLVQSTAESRATDAGEPAESDLGRRRHLPGRRWALVVPDRRPGSVFAPGAGVATRGNPGLETHSRGRDRGAMGSAAAPNPSLEPTRHGARLSSHVSNDQRRSVKQKNSTRASTTGSE